LERPIYSARIASRFVTKVRDPRLLPPFTNRIYSLNPTPATLTFVVATSPQESCASMPMQLIDSFRIPFSTLISYIPIIATIVTTLFSVILARATLRYVEATDKGLALAREEFEREWSPDLHIKLERVSATEARIIVTNLAKTSVLLQLLQLRKLSHATPFERCRLNDPLVGGLTWTQEMGKRILACTGSEFEGPIAAAMTFYAAGRMYRTDWFRSQVVIREGRIVSLEPSTMPTRRVRQLERKGQPERRREFVQDVTAAVAPEKVNDKPDEKFFVTGA
jgi:hypothetical protein